VQQSSTETARVSLPGERSLARARARDAKPFACSNFLIFAPVLQIPDRAGRSAQTCGLSSVCQPRLRPCWLKAKRCPRGACGFGRFQTMFDTTQSTNLAS
jgi:hypothetical protein